MSGFFYQSAQTLLNQYVDRFPLLKITLLLDWQAIEQTLANHKVRYVRDNGGRPTYLLLLMFRAARTMTQFIQSKMRTQFGNTFGFHHFFPIS